MERSRRWFLATGLGGVVGMAGCAGLSFGGEETTTTTSTTATQSEQPTTTEQPTEEPTTTTTTVEPPELAVETAYLLDEIDWFASEHESTVDRYLDVCEQSIRVIERFRGVGTLSETQLEEVRDASMTAATHFDEHLEPHFEVYGPVVESRLAEIEKFSNRGDADRAQQELEELIDHLEDVSSEVFVREELSRNPLQDTVWNALTAGNGVLFGFQNHTSGYTNWVYHTKPDEFNKLTYAAVNDDYREIFAPALAPSERTELVSLTVNRVPSSVSWEKNSLTTLPVLVQRYGSRDAATAAYATVVDGAVTVESEATFGRATWHQGYYDHGGDVQYAYFLQVGAFLFAMAPSTTPWDERDGTMVDLLKRCWLWK
jgi:hypothetical protein